ncbi:atrial natriuretic peptide receptor 1-like [Paramacrobiotus metropolitanus]|uniref:atrial natriuretic peptide receptor 1-like n=1 Tax=Paramacrobiotus metropolitanus TaxID=2943436 RepID=UPI0024462B14|nr:atrial natriuretic peptide receptor 1-like [Paramacrobiotus metropolitanus]
MYASYWMLATALTDIHILNNTTSTNFISGSAISRLLRGRSFHTPIDKSYIDQNGERAIDLALCTFDYKQGNFQPIWKQDKQTFAITQLRGVSDWPNNLWPPPNAPLCGFSGLEGPCTPIASSTVLVASVCSCAAILILIATAFAGIKALQRESRIRNRWWLLSKADLSAFVSNRSTTSILASGLFKQPRAHPDIHFTPKEGVAVLHRQKVFLTQFPTQNAVQSTRQVFLLFDKLREISHANINSISGILSTTTPSKCLNFFVDECCGRYDLETVLSESSRTLVDLEFRHGMTADLLAGLQYTHMSSLRYHGYLQPTNCLVDSRFTVKVSKVGYDRILKEVFGVSAWPSGEAKFIAPEHEKAVSGSPAGDLHALGIVLDMLFNDIVTDTKASPKKLPGKSRIEVFLHAIQQCHDGDPGNRPKLSNLIERHRSAARTSGSAMQKIMRRMERYAENLENCVAERTFQLLSEQRKCDALLAEMLPASIVAILRQGRTVEPEVFDSVSILFSDIVGFGDLVATAEPIDVVVFLNESHSLFDRVVSSYDAYKVETINDCYLVSSGVPVRNGITHALSLSKMATQFVGTFGGKYSANGLAAKIGIHSGSCVAAVAGTKRPRYCLFGDTINTASRMESHGEAGRVHISQPTAELIGNMQDNSVLVLTRGLMPIKGKGFMQTYWVEATGRS